MSGTREDNTHPIDSRRDPVARLLRAAGARPQPPVELERSVREQLHAEWRSLTGAQRRPAGRQWAVAAGLLLVAGLGWWIGTNLSSEPAELGRVASLAGPLERQGADAAAALPRGTAVSAGQRLRSTAGAGITLASGASLRLAAETELLIESAERVQLLAGAVYFDSGREQQEADLPFAIHTAYGDVEHLGTQYETRLVSAGLRLRVREGRVSLHRSSGGELTATGGELLAVSDDGHVQRDRIPTYGDDWDWMDSLAPEFDIDGRPLAEFLSWVARQTGRQLVYADPSIESLAASTILHGSVHGFAPQDALRAILATTALSQRVEGERVIIELR